MDADDPGFQILQSLRRILRQVSRYSRQVRNESGLTIPELLCLRAIADAPADGRDVTVAYIADTVHISRSTASPLLDKLVRAGLVDRQRSTADRRRVHLSLTAQGIHRVERMPAPLEAHFLDGLGQLDEAHRTEVLEVLETIVGLLDAGDIDAAPMLSAQSDLSAPPPSEE